MIIRLTKANFSSNNIGQYTTEPGTLTFNVSPSTASWTLTCTAMSPSTKTGTGNTTWANIPAGSTVSYEVSLSGYNTQKGSISIYGNTTKTITLSEVGSVTPPVEPDEPGNGGSTPSVPTVYKTDKTLGIQMLEFGDFKFQSNSTTQGSNYHCQVVAADVSNYVGKTIGISTTHSWIKGNSTYGDATYCFFLSAAPNGKTPEMLPNVTKLSDLGTTSGNGNMDVILDKSIIVERFDIVTEATKDTYVTKSVNVPAGAKYVYFTHTRKGGTDKEANIVFN